MASQWPAIIGTLTGAFGGSALTGAIGFRLEQTKWRRQQAERWDANRRAAYAEFLVAAQQLLSASHDRGSAEDFYRMAENIAGAEKASSIPGALAGVANASRVLRQCLVQTAGLVEAVRLIASDDVSSLAESAYSALVSVCGAAGEGIDTKPAAWEKANQDAWGALDDFRTGIRRELRITDD